MNNFNLIDQRRSKRPSGAGDEMRRASIGMSMGYGGSLPPGMGCYSAPLNVPVRCVFMVSENGNELFPLRVSPI